MIRYLKKGVKFEISNNHEKPVGVNEGQLLGLIEVGWVWDCQEGEEVGQHRQDETQHYNRVSASSGKQ